MTVRPTATTVSGLGLREAIMPAFAAIVLGAFLVLGAGFAGPELLHNAAHDTRHAFTFPCH